MRSDICLGLLLIASVSSADAQPAPKKLDNFSSWRTSRSEWPRSLPGNTAITLADTPHGRVVQVEYLAKSGKAYLVLFERKMWVEGHWRFKTIDGHKQICFAYPDDAMANGADIYFRNGGCEDAAAYRARLSELCKGNPFDLGKARSTPDQLTYIPIGGNATCGVVTFPVVGTMPWTLNRE